MEMSNREYARVVEELKRRQQTEQTDGVTVEDVSASLAKLVETSARLMRTTASTSLVGLDAHGDAGIKARRQALMDRMETLPAKLFTNELTRKIMQICREAKRPQVMLPTPDVVHDIQSAADAALTKIDAEISEAQRRIEQDGRAW